jgi:TRAP-type mannitol/chloroaromatic compound transport system substrate-binding protein
MVRSTIFINGGEVSIQVVGETSMNKVTRRGLVAGAGALATLATPMVARGETRQWRMVTSWPKRLPGPGLSAERVAERIGKMSGGRLQVQVFAAGELVPALEVLDAVGGGVADIGHTAAFYWQGKEQAAAFFTTVPFGLTPGSTWHGWRPAAARLCGTSSTLPSA